MLFTNPCNIVWSDERTSNSMTNGEFQFKQRDMLYLAFSGKLTPFHCADNFITFQNISMSSRNDQISTQISIHWVPIFLLLWFKRQSHEGDHSLPCVEAKNACSIICTTKYTFMDFVKRLDILITSTNFNAKFSLFINNMFVTLLSSTCFEH